MMTDFHPRDGGHHWDCLEDFDHFGEVDLPRDGDHPRDGGCLREFNHPKGWLLYFGSIESEVSTKNQIKENVSLSVCLSVCLSVI